MFGVADFFKERRVTSTSTTTHPEKLASVDYDVEPGMQVNNGTADRVR